MTEPNSKETIDKITYVPNYEGIAVPDLPPATLAPEVRDLSHIPEYDDYCLPKLELLINSYLEEDGLEFRAAPPAQRLKLKADLAISAHSFLRVPGNNIDDIKALATNLQGHVGQDVEIEQTGPFINASYDRIALANIVLPEILDKKSTYGLNGRGAGETIILDVSSPNIAKSMHLGHLRSTVIGEALSRILYANGYKTIRDNHLGDWGTQFGILSHAHSLWSHEVPELEDPATQVSGLQKLYVKINTAIAEEKAQTGASDLEEEGRKWFTRLENGDPEAHELWEWAGALSMKEFEKVYETLGVNFEYVLGESVYSGMSEDIYKVLQEKGIAQTDEKNRLQMIPSDSSLHNLTIRKSDGSSLYGTRDIATLCARMEWFNPKKIIYVVGNEQRDYFKQVFDGFTQVAGEETPELKHLGFGAIQLPEGKMSTRAGNVVFLSDVLDEAYSRAYDRVTKNAADNDLKKSEEELVHIAEQVAVGAVIYYDLKQVGDRKIIFSWDEVLNFEGNSGPYLQYSHARMKALLDEAEKEPEAVTENINLDKIDPIGPESDIVALLSEFPLAIKNAGDKYEPAVLSDYLYRLAHTFNIFYSKLPILKESDIEARANRILITHCAKQVLKNGLTMLNIPTPDRM